MTTSIWKNARSELSEVNEVLGPQNGAPKGQLEDNEDRKTQWKYLRRGGCTERRLYGPFHAE